MRGHLGSLESTVSAFANNGLVTFPPLLERKLREKKKRISLENIEGPEHVELHSILHITYYIASLLGRELIPLIVFFDYRSLHGLQKYNGDFDVDGHFAMACGKVLWVKLLPSNSVYSHERER